MDTTFSVQGMSCGHCERSVEEEVGELAGVESAQADHRSGVLTVRGEQLDPTAIRAAVQAAGYEVAA